jgi:uncharacterized membrane protein
MRAKQARGGTIGAALRRGPLITAGVLLGLGLGGFVDGILLHQILQWHHLLTSAGFPPDTVQNLRVNTLWDGLFHASTWTLTTAGLVMLWRAAGRQDVPWSTSIFVGALALGWGIFNLIEGIADHHILGLHHVNETVPRNDWLYWDLAFLALGAALAFAGWRLVRRGRRDVGRAAAESEGRMSRRGTDQAA